jgi:hypothetical protein
VPQATKPGTPPQPATDRRSQGPVEKILDASLPGGLSAAARTGLREQARQPSYLKLAFANPYNISLLAGGLAASVITLNPIPAVVALGLEGLWLLHGPDNTALRRLVWDPKIDADRKASDLADRQVRIRTLGELERSRVEALSSRRQEIGNLAAQNPSFTGDLLRTELLKTDRLVDAFVELSLTCARYEAYLASVDDRAMQRDVDRYAAAVRTGAPDDPRTGLSQKNLAIVLKRQERMKEIKRYLGVAKGQLDLIENSFQLIADQIVTMQSPQELSGQLDELLNGVEAIRETARDTEALLGPTDKEL